MVKGLHGGVWVWEHRLRVQGRALGRVSCLIFQRDSCGFLGLKRFGIGLLGRFGDHVLIEVDLLEDDHLSLLLDSLLHAVCAVVDHGHVQQSD